MSCRRTLWRRSAPPGSSAERACCARARRPSAVIAALASSALRTGRAGLFYSCVHEEVRLGSLSCCRSNPDACSSDDTGK
eukprot:789715-Rhodomonas_salina.2